MKTSVVAQLPLLTCTLSRTNCTQSQVDTCSIVQFYGKYFMNNSNSVVHENFSCCTTVLFTCALTRTNCTQSQVDTCSIVQLYGKLKCAKEDGGARNDLIFSCREATYDSFYAKITSRPILAGFGLHRTTGSILTLADS